MLRVADFLRLKPVEIFGIASEFQSVTGVS
jgi:hypothetical protein